MSQSPAGMFAKLVPFALSHVHLAAAARLVTEQQRAPREQARDAALFGFDPSGPLALSIVQVVKPGSLP